MSSKKDKIITLTVHGNQKLKNRFKIIFGRWKEFQLEQDKHSTPTQKGFMNTMLDLMASELGVEL